MPYGSCLYATDTNSNPKPNHNSAMINEEHDMMQFSGRPLAIIARKSLRQDSTLHIVLDLCGSGQGLVLVFQLVSPTISSSA